MKRNVLFILAVLLASCAGVSNIAPRVPPHQLAAIQAMKNPFPSDLANIARGKALFLGKGRCSSCHGNEGRGDGPAAAAAALNPAPTDLTNAEFHRVRTPGEIFWAIDNGIPRTAMVSFTKPKFGQPAVLTQDEAWLIVLYVQSLGGNP